LERTVTKSSFTQDGLAGYHIGETTLFEFSGKGCSGSSDAGCVLDPTIAAELKKYASAQPLCAGFLNASAPPYSAGVSSGSSMEASSRRLDEQFESAGRQGDST
jgi:hypothetical protein